jgi:hypothetical protein
VRRLLAGAAAAGLGLIAIIAPSAQAAEADWAGSHIETPASSPTPNPNLVGIFVRKYNSLQSLSVKAYQTPPSGLAQGCPAAEEQLLGTATLTPESNNSGRATAASSTPCNGTYSFRLVAHLTAGGLARADDYTLSGTVDIRVAPPAVTDLTAKLNTQSIDLEWDKPSDPAPDFIGYRIQRAKGDGWETLADRGPDDNSYADTAPPPEGGKQTYRVFAMRDATKSPVLSAPSESASVDLPTPGGDPTDPNSTTTTTAKPGSGGGDGGTTGTTVKPGSGGGSAPIGGRSFKPLPKGQIGMGTKAPRLGTPASSNITDLLADDGGFDEELNYGDRSLAGDESEDGENGLSSFYYEGSGGQGMAKPVAIGSVFLAWAFHMRFLAKAAKPAAASSRKRGRSKHAAPKRGWA